MFRHFQSHPQTEHRSMYIGMSSDGIAIYIYIYTPVLSLRMALKSLKHVILIYYT
jgi:hypothetical protein